MPNKHYDVVIIGTGAGGGTLASESAPTGKKILLLGTATYTVESGKRILRVSADFKVTDTQAPTWRVIDSKGNVYTLDGFKIKAGNGEKREVMVPAYVKDIVKVQVYCAWAEVILGEAGFSTAVS
jgi:cation diffusion facilitator CzcD-associated flavoprotein CzcO